MGGRQGGKQHTVLVVEDDDVVRGIITTLLEDEGYRVIAGANGAAALQMLGDPAAPTVPGVPEPEVVLLDMWMPVMDGREFIGAFRGAGHRAPIIAMTGALFVTATQAAPPADDLLSKPFDLDELLALVRKHLGREHVGRELVPA